MLLYSLFSSAQLTCIFRCHRSVITKDPRSRRPALTIACRSAPCDQACAGYTDLTGVDYARDAVRLARLVAEDKKAGVTFEVRHVDVH